MLGLISSIGSTVLTELSFQPLFLLFRVLVDQPQKAVWLFLRNKWKNPSPETRDLSKPSPMGDGGGDGDDGGGW